MKHSEANSLSSSRILGEACHEAGVGREVFEDVSESLEQLVESLNRDAALHPSGQLRAANLLKQLRQPAKVLGLRSVRLVLDAATCRRLRYGHFC